MKKSKFSSNEIALILLEFDQGKSVEEITRNTAYPVRACINGVSNMAVWMPIKAGQRT